MSLLEVCASDLKSVRTAVAGQAYRIELCSALSADGLTPSLGMIYQAARICGNKTKMNVLIRPDEDPGYVIDDDTIDVVLRDIDLCGQAGTSGVVIGALTKDGMPDESIVFQAVKQARRRGMTVTFHRAFDITPDPIEAMEMLIKLGCDCILTSGQAPTAEKGAGLIAELIRRADGRIEIMPGAGINPGNAAMIARTTGCSIMHSSCRLPGRLSSDKETVCKIVNSIRR